MIADLKRGYPDYVMDGEDSLVFAMKDVYAHTKCPFIILIDEWDCLFREYKQDKEAQKISGFPAGMDERSGICGTCLHDRNLPIKNTVRIRHSTCLRNIP